MRGLTWNHSETVSSPQFFTVSQAYSVVTITVVMIETSPSCKLYGERGGLCTPIWYSATIGSAHSISASEVSSVANRWVIKPTVLYLMSETFNSETPALIGFRRNQSPSMF
jgi:hypothetical protein